MQRKVKKNLHITEGQERKLKALSAKTGAPEAEIIRRALDSYFAEKIKFQTHENPGFSRDF